jgi:DNA-binding transcriptional regulator YdaS (Cro superfamily)
MYMQGREAIREAINRAGGVFKFAKAMGVTHQAVYYWLKRGFVPPERAVAIEAIFKVDRNRTMDPALVEVLNTPVADLI